MSIFYGIIRGNSVEFEKDHEWSVFTAANQNRKIYLEIGFETKQRTSKQNNSLWLGMKMLADQLNAGGLDMRKVLKETVDIPWDKNTVHDYLFVPVMTAMKQKKSTTELTKEEVSEIWEVLTKHLAEKHGADMLPFPSQITKNSYPLV